MRFRATSTIAHVQWPGRWIGKMIRSQSAWMSLPLYTSLIGRDQRVTPLYPACFSFAYKNVLKKWHRGKRPGPARSRVSRSFSVAM